jgi:hypothetical protein
MDIKTAIILFVYKRPEHTKRVLEGLKKNEVDHLIIFSDGAKRVEDQEGVEKTRALIKNIEWCSVELHVSEQNKGLAQSVIEGVTEVLNRYDKVIVLEDDCVPDKHFVKFMTTCLNKYEHNQEVMSISGYSCSMDIPADYQYNVFFHYRSSSWGWGTWKRAWHKVDWEMKDYQSFIVDKKAQQAFKRGGEDLVGMLEAQMKGHINSWAIRWAYAHFKHNAWCVYPTHSLIKNIGFDALGTHTTSGASVATYGAVLNNDKNEWLFPDQPFIDERIYEKFNKIFLPPLIHRLKKHLKNFLT